MKRLQFRCRLLSEVIVSQRAATEGQQETLGFIPGNVFLGIVAAGYGQYTKAEQMTLFHSGKVRFGDAHPVFPGAKIRSFHVPTALFYPKKSGMKENFFIHHFYNRDDDHTGIGGGPQQLKQCREGFFTVEGNCMTEIVLEKSYAIKSAYNREWRRSEDSKMYGYESLAKGSEFLFTIECDEDELADKIVVALEGVKHIGRSRTAQYGLAEIMPCNFKEIESTTSTFTLDDHQCISVYADGRLIFLDKFAEPTFRPSASDFGLDGEIVWEKSQVRTFQYAPWNAKRQTRDSDRAGFEKGTTFVIRLNNNELPCKLPSYVGNYQNEGFGKVVYGWDLLQNSGKNGLFPLSVQKIKSKENTMQAEFTETPLLAFLARKQNQSSASAYIYEAVNSFANKNGKLFSKSQFASQWGAIRSIATRHASCDDIMKELFYKKKIKKRNPTPDDRRTEIVEEPAAFLTHGVALTKWKGEPFKKLEEFVLHMGKTEFGDLSQKALINLASEMAKKQNNDDNNKI